MMTRIKTVFQIKQGASSQLCLILQLIFNLVKAQIRELLKAYGSKHNIFLYCFFPHIPLPLLFPIPAEQEVAVGTQLQLVSKYNIKYLEPTSPSSNCIYKHYGNTRKVFQAGGQKFQSLAAKCFPFSLYLNPI